jgi:hypothetical protein
MDADQMPITPDAQRTANRLLEALQRGRDGAAAPDPCVPGPRAIDAKTALMEQAKGALMLRYGVDSHQAFAVLVRWAQVSHTPVRTVAHTLLHGICEGNPQTGVRQGALIRWLQAQLRDDVPDMADLPAAPVSPRTSSTDSPLA